MQLSAVCLSLKWNSDGNATGNAQYLPVCIKKRVYEGFGSRMNGFEIKASGQYEIGG